MPKATPTIARDQVAPTLQKAQETLTDTVLPAVRDALALAREKSVELLDSDTALEAKRRGRAVVHAAAGRPVVAPAGKRWRFGFGMIALGTGIGFGVSYLMKRLAAPVDSYTYQPPFPSGTDGGTMETGNVTTTSGSTAMGTSADGATAGTPNESIDLRSGAPTNP
jgi:hypothetical protein